MSDSQETKTAYGSTYTDGKVFTISSEAPETLLNTAIPGIPVIHVPSKGTKFDGNKADLSLIPLIALQEEAKAFQVGEKKYGRYNYCKGMEASRIVAAIQRHVAQWFNGEENDPVDGQHHLGAARAGLAMLLRQQELGTMIDNRYKPEGDNK